MVGRHPLLVDGRPQPPRGQTPLMEACTVTPDYFRAMNIPLLRGRYFTDQDNRAFIAGRDLSKLNDGERLIAGSNVIIVDDLFAKQHWPNEEAVGKRIRFGSDAGAPVLEVVGVVGRVKMESLSDDSNRVQGYFSFGQLPFNGMTVIIKGTGDPNQLIAAARAQVKAVDPDQPIYNIRTMEEIRGESVAPQRLNLMLLSIFAGIAFVPRNRWDLWGYVLRGHAADSRNRNSHGDWSAAARCLSNDPGAGNVSHDRRHGCRAARSFWPDQAGWPQCCLE